MENNTYLYTGSPIVPKYTLNIGGKVLERDKDFDVEISDNINVGTAHVTITGKGKFKGKLERTFEILPIPARSLSFFADNTEFIYTGEPCIMKVAVRFGEMILKEGQDYDIEYSDNTQPGTGNATLTFKGNYFGVMSIPFTIDVPDPEDDDPDAVYDDLENLSELSDQSITIGESTIIRTAAKGGKAPYTYAVYYRKSIEQKWFVLQHFSSDSEAEMTPVEATRYIVLVKAKDIRGEVAKKYFKLVVNDREEA
ncbi:MAG: hypothetical protein IJU51_03390 [Clostridia bacterium]|nr:hypothetical protein [Clostridia bacterium]